jgi:hypothetical protein
MLAGEKMSIERRKQFEKIVEWLTWLTVVLWLITVTVLFYLAFKGKLGIIKEDWNYIALIATTIVCYVITAIAIAKYEVIARVRGRDDIVISLVELYSYVPPVVGLVFYVHMLRREDLKKWPRLIYLAYLCLATIGLLSGHGFWVLVIIASSHANVL